MSTEEKTAEKPAEKPTEKRWGDGERRMTFLEHLLELRSRMVSAAIGIAITTVATLIFYQYVFDFLRAPLDNVNEKFRTDTEYVELLKVKGFPAGQEIVQMITTDPLSMMMVLMKIAVYAGLILSSPWILYQIWSFVAPGLTPREAGAIRPVLIGGIFFFIAGAAFCYYVVFPLTLEFLVYFDVTQRLRPSYVPTDYYGLLLTFMLIFGAVFELPLVSAVFARLGLLKPEWLTKFWRYVIVGCFVAGSILSPGGDPISMIVMSTSILFLYGLSIVMARVFYAKRQKAKAEAEDAAGTPSA